MALSAEEQLQRYLHFLGEDPGIIDGIRGDNTDGALAALLKNDTYQTQLEGLDRNSDTADLLPQLQEAAESAKHEYQNRFDQARSMVDRLETLDSGELRELQSALKEMNLYHDRVDGFIGPNTRAAAEMFTTIFADDIDAAQSRQLETAREQAQSAIADSAAGKQPDDVIRQTWEQTRDSSALGREGRMELQRNLQAMGLYEGKIDADIGPLSNRAIDQFNTLFAEEIAQFETQRVNAVRDKALVRDNPQAPNLFEQTYPLIERQGELSREELKTLQGNLHTLGLYQDTIDGRMDPNTRGAIGQFNTIMADDITALKETRLREARAHIDETLGCIAGLDALSPEQTATLRANLSRIGFEAGTGETQDKTFFQAVGAYARQHNLEFYKAQLVAAAEDDQSIAANTPTTFNAEVLRRQQQLTFAGIDPGPHDGHWKDGGFTDRAQAAFENIHTVEATPLSDLKEIKQYQAGLKAAGYFNGDITGELDAQTIAATRRFVSQNPRFQLGLPPDAATVTSRHAAAVKWTTRDMETRFFRNYDALKGVKIAEENITHNQRAHISVALDKDGNVIGGNRPFDRGDPMSISKMMTLLTLAEMGENGELPDGMSMHEFSRRYESEIKQMMYHSHNDAPVNLARLATGGTMAAGRGRLATGGNSHQFVERMNRTAEEIGLFDTHFSSREVTMRQRFRDGNYFKDVAGPVGWNPGDGSQFMTAYDAARIGQVLSQRHEEVFKEFVRDYTPYRGKTGTGHGDYEIERGDYEIGKGKARSFIGVNDDGTAFAMMEVKPQQFAAVRQEMSRMAASRRLPQNPFEEVLERIFGLQHRISYSPEGEMPPGQLTPPPRVQAQQGDREREKSGLIQFA